MRSGRRGAFNQRWLLAENCEIRLAPRRLPSSHFTTEQPRRSWGRNFETIKCTRISFSVSLKLVRRRKPKSFHPLPIQRLREEKWDRQRTGERWAEGDSNRIYMGEAKRARESRGKVNSRLLRFSWRAWVNPDNSFPRLLHREERLSAFKSASCSLIWSADPDNGMLTCFVAQLEWITKFPRYRREEILRERISISWIRISDLSGLVIKELEAEVDCKISGIIKIVKHIVQSSQATTSKSNVNSEKVWIDWSTAVPTNIAPLRPVQAIYSVTFRWVEPTSVNLPGCKSSRC